MAQQRIWDSQRRTYRWITLPNLYAIDPAGDDSFQPAAQTYDSHPEASEAISMINQISQQLQSETSPRAIKALHRGLKHWTQRLEIVKRKYGGFSGLGAGVETASLPSYAVWAFAAYVLYKMMK